MDINTYDDIIALQANFGASFQERLKALNEPGANAVAFLINLKLQALKDAEAALVASKAARDELSKRLDESIAQQDEAATQLRQDIEILKRSLAGGVNAPQDIAVDAPVAVRAAPKKKKR